MARLSNLEPLRQSDALHYACTKVTDCQTSSTVVPGFSYNGFTETVRVMSQRKVRTRLCPSSTKYTSGQNSSLNHRRLSMVFEYSGYTAHSGSAKRSPRHGPSSIRFRRYHKTYKCNLRLSDCNQRWPWSSPPVAHMP